MHNLKNRYDLYLAEAEKARQRAGFCDGLFGLGKDPRKAACHDDFYEYVAGWVQEFLEHDPSAAECAAAVEWIVKLASAHWEQKDTFGYLYAIHGHIMPLIPRMDREAAKEVASWYEGAYPRRKRMPVQEQVFKALKKAAR